MKIVVGMPGGNVRLGRTADDLDQMIRHSERAGHSVMFMPRSSSVPSQNQNHIFWSALDAGADAVMLVDSDMSFPADALCQLEARGVGMVGAAYRQRGAPYNIVIGLLDGAAQIEKTGFHSVAHVPSGMIFVRRNVLEAVGYPWMEEIYGNSPDELVGHDVQFCRKVRAAGYEVYVDMDLSHQVFHLGVVPIGLEQIG